MAVPNLTEVANSLAERIPDLAAELSALLQEVPPGQVTTYGTLAKALGDTAASRWVATFLLDADGPLAAVSHRVIRSTGEIGLFYSGDVQEKANRLRAEGVTVSKDRVDLATFGGELSRGPSPLALLKAWQREFVGPQEPFLKWNDVQTIGGIDVSYAKRQAVSVCSRFDADGKSLLENHSHTEAARFPYITGYLAFRELPLHLALLSRLQATDVLPSLLLVDGNGRLHPRRMGIATMLGALTGIPTMGVAKKLICGTILKSELAVGEWEPILASRDEPEEVLGYAIRPHEKTKHPIYVSRGYGVDDQTMKVIVERCLVGHRLPEPIYQADRVSRAIASNILDDV